MYRKKLASILCVFNGKNTMNVYAVVTAKPRGKPTKRLVDCTAKARTTYSMI